MTPAGGPGIVTDCTAGELGGVDIEMTFAACDRTVATDGPKGRVRTALSNWWWFFYFTNLSEEAAVRA